MPRLFLSLLFFCFTIQMWSQPPTQEQLEERKAKIQLEIQEKEQLLQSVKSKEKSVVTQLMIQKEKIGLKEKLIKTTEKQTKLLGNDIYINQVKINQQDASGKAIVVRKREEKKTKEKKRDKTEE